VAGGLLAPLYLWGCGVALFLRGRSWYYEFMYKRQRYRGCIGPVSKTIAKEVLNRVKAEAIQGGLGVHTTKDPVFRYYAEEWLAHRKPSLRPSSYKRTFEEVNLFIRLWGDKRLSQITPQIISEWAAQRLEEGCVNDTVRRDLTVLGQMYKTAVLWRQATANPVAGVRKPRAGAHRVRWLTAEEEARLLKACNPFVRPVVIAALQTGFRRGELLGLCWGDVDFSRGIMRVRAELAKSHEGREVPINSQLRQVLEQGQPLGHTPETPVFTSRYRRSWRDINWSFKDAVTKAGITDFRFHDLRHTFASRLVMAGVHLIVVKELMGHTDISMTMRYAHLSSDYKQKAVDLL
jgi:integrase